MSYLGVDVIGKIERRGIGAQFHDVALGADRVYAVLEEITANLVEKVGSLVAGLPPVGGHAELGVTMHLVRSNLNFDGLARRAHNGRMQ